MMEATMTLAQKNLQGKIALYRVSWFVFMVMVFAPAWMYASSVEGVDFSMALWIVKKQLAYVACPPGLAEFLSYPITLLATVIPGSSRFALFPVLSVFGGLSIFVAFIYFAIVQPPFYRALKFKLDPQWEEKEDAKWIVKPKYRFRVTFRGMVKLILISSLIGEVIFGFLRPPTADSFVGKVYLLNRHQVEVPLDVTLKLDILSPGVVFDVKPNVSNRSVYMKFEGKDLATLQKLGIDPKFFGDAVDKDGYGSVLCDAAQGGRTYNTAGFSPFHSLVVNEYYENTQGYDHENVRCPKDIRFGMEDFNVGQFAISDISKDYIIVADMTRKSRWSPLQQWIMEKRYNSSPSTFYHNSK
jgi:hypothetical protein